MPFLTLTIKFEHEDEESVEFLCPVPGCYSKIAGPIRLERHLLHCNTILASKLKRFKPTNSVKATVDLCNDDDSNDDLPSYQIVNTPGNDSPSSFSASDVDEPEHYESLSFNSSTRKDSSASNLSTDDAVRKKVCPVLDITMNKSDSFST